MKRIVSCIVSVLVCVILHAQEVEERSKAQILYDKAYEAALNEEYEKMLAYLDEGVVEADGDLLKDYYFLYGYLYEMYAYPCYYNDPQQAFEFYQKAYQYYFSAGSKNWSLGALKHMGYLKVSLNQYDDALKIWDLAIENFDKTDYAVIEIIIYKKKVHRMLNQYDLEAEMSLELDQLYGSVTDSKSKVKILSHLAEEACEKSNFYMARVYFDDMERLLPEVEEVYRETFIHNLILEKHALLINEKKYAEAIELISSMIAEMEHDSAYPSSLILGYIYLADDYSMSEEKALAQSALQKAIELLSEADLSEMERSQQYMAIAGVYASLKMEAEAIEYVDKARSINVLNDNIILLHAALLSNLAQYEESRAMHEAYSEYVETYYGKNSLQYAEALMYLANINAFCDKIEQASDKYIQAVELARGLFTNGYRYMSISEREAFLGEFHKLFTSMTSFGLKAGFEQDAFTRTAYDALLLTKGILLSSDKSISAIVYGSGDDELIRMYEKCKELNTEIEVYKASAGVSSDEAADVYGDLMSMERKLQESVSLNDKYMDYIDVGYEKIRSALKENEVVVDFTDFRGVNDPTRRFYAAYVYRKDWDSPKMIEVFEGKDLQPLLDDGELWDCYKYHAVELAKLIFTPLKDYVHEGDVLYWVPSGDLHKLSVESLLLQVAPKSKLTFKQLSSAKTILDMSHDVSVNTAVLYGGLDFSCDCDSSVTATSRISADSGLFEELPESYVEVCLVRDILQGDNCDVKMYEGHEGTESSFVAFSGQSPDLIHLSTHGFYYSPGDASSVSLLSGFDNSMFLSGLILSGGNNEWAGSNLSYKGNGGVLTADDISKLDLSGTELVVLSACDTGRGQITSEGVYGLQRAFKKAGADKVVMTLWRVNDTVSKDFMEEFYSSLISYGLQPEAALLHAKETFKKNGYSPYYWAGYVLLD